MRAYHSLLDGYREVLQINMQSDRKTALKINVGAGIVNVLVLVAGHFIVPYTEFLNMSPVSAVFLRFAVMIIAYIVYMAMHELTHAAVMKAVGGGKVVFGFTGLYAFAGSREDWFDKTAYRCIALAPLIVWGIIFGFLAFLVPRSWFWVVWFLQSGNIGGAAGDVYVTAKLWHMPDTILVRDTGVDMTVYGRQE